MNPDSARISQAIVVWTGWATMAWPARDEARLISYFGQEDAIELLPEIRRLESEFYMSDAKDTEPDVSMMGAKAAERFRNLHPELSSDSISALSWCYTYDYK